MTIWTLLLTLFSLHAANYREDFKKQIYVNGVGQVKLVYLFSGEPVSRPRSLSIYVKCQGTKEWEPVGQYQMCELKDYQYDAKTRKLSVQYVDGRVNPVTGVSVCDQRGEGQLDLGALCKP